MKATMPKKRKAAPSKETMARLIGQRVRAARAAAGMGQIEASERAGIVQGYLSDIERGKSCSVVTLAKIAAALGVDLVDLLPNQGGKP